MAIGTVAGWALPPHPTYLSVVPMFHCNGWNHPWAMAIVGGHIVFTRDATPATAAFMISVCRSWHDVARMGRVGAPYVCDQAPKELTSKFSWLLVI